MENIKENELKELLEDLKKCLQSFDYSSIDNVIFLNVDAFYSYADKFCKDKDKTVSLIMNKLEPYIPLTLFADTEIINLFITAGLSECDKELKALEERFYKKARVEFMDMIRRADTEDKWNYIVELCKTMI